MSDHEEAVRDEDIEFHAWPRPERGGQHTGLSGSGVLVIHKPTGIAAVSTDERSQFANREKATAKLRQLLAADEELRRVRAETLKLAAGVVTLHNVAMGSGGLCDGGDDCNLSTCRDAAAVVELARAYATQPTPHRQTKETL